MPRKTFDPISASRKIEESYRGYIASTIHFSNSKLQHQLNCMLSTPGYLAKGPFLEAAPPYVGKESLRNLVDRGIFCESMLRLGGGNPSHFDVDRKLYEHQVNAIELAHSGNNIIVTTGTGSGKTECFLLPILDDILREFEQTGPKPGVRAMLLYPMNALANDQLKRLRQLLEGLPITFGRYTGDTEDSQTKAEQKWAEENPGQHRGDNELISRQVMREEPPNILITNYSMLEYLLLRPKDSTLFSGAFATTWRHIAIDEAHVYSGALGTEIAFLLRRLKARIAEANDSRPRLRCYATSATIGSKNDKDLYKIARFAEDLFGEPFHRNREPNVVIGAQDDPVNDLRAIWGELSPETWLPLRDLMQHEKPSKEEIIQLLHEELPAPELELLQDTDSIELGVGKVLLGERNANKLICEAGSGPIDLTLNANSSTSEEETHLGFDSRLLTAMVDVLSRAQRRNGVPVMNSRYHFFMRGPEGLFINLHTGKLSPHKTVSADIDGVKGSVPVYEIAACRHCGEAYLLGREQSSLEEGLSYLDPKPVGEDPGDLEALDPLLYYRILETPKDITQAEELQWLCPTCGSLHNTPNGGLHRFEHDVVDRIPIAKGEADEKNSRCPQCGYTNVNAIQPMRVSPESVGSVVCYDLVRLVPPFDVPKEPAQVQRRFRLQRNQHHADEDNRAGSVICFSDRRQDAAFFAPAMERTYNNITIRQILHTAVIELSEDSEGIPPSRVRRWIESEGMKRYGSLFRNPSDIDLIATAWVIGEMMTDTPRNSLEGLGVIRIEPTEVLQAFRDDEVRGVAQADIEELGSSFDSWLTVEDYFIFLRHCLETIRRGGGLIVPEVNDRLDKHFKSRFAEYLKRRTRVRPKFVTTRSQSNDERFLSFIGLPTGPENARSHYIRKYARTRYGVELSRQESTDLLACLHRFLLDVLGGWLYGERPDLFESKGDSFRLGMDLWRLYPSTQTDRVWICDSCGCEFHWDHNGVCPTHRCCGQLRELSLAETASKDAHYKKAYRETALPLRIEEHTAQLSSERAREVQSDFIHGKVNVLSCTTTFELGVDVGDLRCVFMRNVPPQTANYTQRAGRVGRREGKPGFAVTFARLRSHDLAQFKNPKRILTGSNPIPSCHLNNQAIALRHVFAVALSEYFRIQAQNGEDCSYYYDSFLSFEDSDPQGMKALRSWLNRQPEPIKLQLLDIFAGNEKCAAALGISTWEWVDKLMGTSGRLVRTHALKHDDYERLHDAIERNVADGNHSGAGTNYKRMDSLLKQRTIDVLADNGVLPKYGFPTDLVELNIPSYEQSLSKNPLRLQRGLRQAIREYAPGNEIIANKRVWKSIGIRKIKGRSLEVRRYGFCPNCGAFVWPIDDDEPTATCKACHAEVQLTQKMLIPSEGFIAEREEREAGEKRPERSGTFRIEFCQNWEDEKHRKIVEYPGGTLHITHAANGQLCAMNNAAKAGYNYCSYCGASAIGNEPLNHQDWCETRFATHYHALGCAFTSDVLEFRIDLNDKRRLPREDWESLSWAIYTAAANLLEIPAGEIGATLYPNDMGAYSIMLYDDVPGGAGHAQQLAERAKEILHEAYRLVANCTCGEDTCCYGCLCNYYNQTRQHLLSRGAALAILDSLGVE